MNASTQVVIIGAGPYGLSLAAHLRQAGVDTRIFGQPMLTWQTQMPAGMHLKSDGFGSNLSDARKTSYSLGQFSSEIRAPYHDTLIAVPLANFIAYGKEFQRRFVPHLDTQNVTNLEKAPGGFVVTLENGDTVSAAQVVIAVGISHFQYLPPVFAGLPQDLVTHTAAHSDPGKMAGREVTVIGAGASAIGLAGLMQEAGAQVSIVTRRQKLKFGAYPSQRSLWQRMRHPMSELGPGWRSWGAQHFPHLFQMLPAELRVKVVRKALGPSGGYYSRESVIGKVNEILECSVKNAEVENGKVKLTLDCNGAGRIHITSHVICGTGYQVNLDRLAFLPDALKQQIQLAGTAPALDRNFQSTVPGLFFVGPASANTFGPLMRFAAGARYTSTWLAKYLKRHAKRTGTVAATPRKEITNQPGVAAGPAHR